VNKEEVKITLLTQSIFLYVSETFGFSEKNHPLDKPSGDFTYYLFYSLTVAVPSSLYVILSPAEFIPSK